MKTIHQPGRDLPVISEADVVVAGGGPTGIAAALSASRNGAQTILLEKNGFLGGNATMGLPLFCFLDLQGNKIIDGIPQEIIDRLKERGGASPHYRCGLFSSYTICDSETLKATALEMLEESGVELFLHTLSAGAIKKDRTIQAVLTESKSGCQAITGKVYVDCTGDGDLAAGAGATFQMGNKEGRLQPPTLMFFVRGVDVQALRKALAEKNSRYKLDDRMPVEQVTDREHFLVLGMNDILSVARAKGDWKVPRDKVSLVTTMREDEVAVNMTRVLDVDATNVKSLTRAELAARKQISEVISVLKKYIPGFENAILHASAPTIGIRETRRINGWYALTGEDVLNARRFKDEVLLAGYPVDIHDPDGAGATYIQSKGAYGIPFRCLVPKDLDNLLVAGRCLSATHEGLAATRVMVTCMATGEAAGCAAAMAHNSRIRPKDLEVEALRTRLREQGVCLDI